MLSVMDVFLVNDIVYLICANSIGHKQVTEIKGKDATKAFDVISKYNSTSEGSAFSDEELEVLNTLDIPTPSARRELASCFPAYIPVQIGTNRWCVRCGCEFYVFEIADDLELASVYTSIACDTHYPIDYKIVQSVYRLEDFSTVPAHVPYDILDQLKKVAVPTVRAWRKYCMDTTPNGLSLIDGNAEIKNLLRESRCITNAEEFLKSVPCIRSLKSPLGTNLPGESFLTRHRTIDVRGDFHPYQIGRDNSKDIAILKGVAEAAERLSCQLWPPREHRISATAQQLDAKAIDLNSIIGYADVQLESKNFATGVCPVDQDTEIDWCEVSDLHGDMRYAPIDLLYYGVDYLGEPNRHRCFYANSSGAACHSSLQNALNSATLELIEREAIMIWWINRLSPPRIPLSWLDKKEVEAARQIEERGYDVFILDITLDLYPVVLAIALNRESAAPLFFSGAACSTSLSQAICQAMTELETAAWHHLNFPREHFLGDPHEVITPQDHGDYYLAGKRKSDLLFLTTGKESTRGKNTDTVLNEQVAATVDRAGVKLYWRDVTSEEIANCSSLRVVHAVSNLFPMTFGYGYEPLAHPRISQAVDKLAVSASCSTPLDYMKDYKLHFFA